MNEFLLNFLNITHDVFKSVIISNAQSSYGNPLSNEAARPLVETAAGTGSLLTSAHRVTL